MVNINHLIISGILAIVLANYVFPRMIYLMCEMILWLNQVISLSKGEKQFLWYNGACATAYEAGRVGDTEKALLITLYEV